MENQKVIVTNEITGEKNTVIGKSNINGNKGTVNIINYNYRRVNYENYSTSSKSTCRWKL